MRIMLTVVLLLLALGWITGCGGGLTTSRVAREVTDRAPQFIGPADSYQADVRDVRPGLIGLVRVTGVGVHPLPGLLIDPLTLTLQDVRYQVSPFRVQEVGQATFDARVSEAAINEYLRLQNRTSSGLLKNVRIQLLPGGVRALAAVSVMNVDIPIETAGRISATDGVRLNYAVDQLIVGGLGVPAGITNILTALINPVYDLSSLRFTPRITRLIPMAGTLEISGSAILRNLP